MQNTTADFRILHHALPKEMVRPLGLPGVRPVEGPWLRCDEAYAGQMFEKRRLLKEARTQVMQCEPDLDMAAEELLREVEALLPGLGFQKTGEGWQCPDGETVSGEGHALWRLGRLCQMDFCLMHKPSGADEHVLGGAVLCFPASWRLEEKFRRGLGAIHGPVAEYDSALAKRVQRLFDGVQVGRPLWRFNQLWYQDASLFQPRSEGITRPLSGGPQPYLRCERQVILRLPETRVVVFGIHTYVLRREDAPSALLSGAGHGDER